MTTKCMEANGALDTWGYGRVKIAQKSYGAHRIAYMLFNGPIKGNLQVDHICRNRACINPKHLRLVTQKENLLAGEGFAAKNKAKTLCKRGHKLPDSNGTRRICKACRCIHQKQYTEKKASHV